MKKVIILGGGVAGMSAAHELSERGFAVQVYDRNPRYPGGKARSVDIDGTDINGSNKLPGEHGFRFFPGFYKHITDTMQRIPFGDGQTVYDNLVPVNRFMMARYGKQPIVGIVNFPESLADLKVALASYHSDTGLTEGEKELFAMKIWQLMTSCYERRLDEYERTGWWQFMEADSQSETYQHLLVEGLTRTLVAANAKFASTRTGGDIFIQLIFNVLNPMMHADRVLNGPTNDVWLTPWYEYLTIEKGVAYHLGCNVNKLYFNGNIIIGAQIQELVLTQDEAGNYKMTVARTYEINDPDAWYILAVPVERATELMTKEMIAKDMTLDGLSTLAEGVRWMNGAQFYLNQEVDLVHGHCIYSDSQWALTSISQIQFWKDYDISKAYNGKVKSILSVDISNWTKAGINGKAGEDCNREDIKKEIWAELKASLNVDGKTVLSDDMIEYSYIDGDIQKSNVPDHKEVDLEPLLVNRVGTWDLRPNAHCNIPNLFFASDYVRTFTDLATMEGANEAARRAVNCILSSENSDEKMCEIWPLHEPALLAGLRKHDKNRYDLGLPWQYHETWWMDVAKGIEHLLKKIF